MRSAVSCPFWAGVLLVLTTNAVQAAEPAGFYVEHAQVLGGLQRHVVVLNEELRTQLPYGSSVHDPYLTQQLAQNAVANTLSTVPAASMGQMMAAGAAGGLIAGAIIAAAMKEEAKSLVEPAHLSLQEAGCRLPGGQALASAVSESMAAAPWARGVSPQHVVLSGNSDIDDVVDTKTSRHVLSAAYSMAPDFSTVITSLKVDTYAPGIGDADRKWASRPARTDRLIVFSDQVSLAPKTPEDIEKALAREHERHASGPARELIAKANAGDIQARKAVVPLIKDHEKRLREAKLADWTPANAAVMRSRMWSSDGCRTLADALQANNAELGRLLADLYAGRLPVAAEVDPRDAQVDTMAPLPDEEPGIRKTLSLPGNLYLSRRGGDHAPLAHLYTWYKP